MQGNQANIGVVFCLLCCELEKSVCNEMWGLACIAA